MSVGTLLIVLAGITLTAVIIVTVCVCLPRCTSGPLNVPTRSNTLRSIEVTSSETLVLAVLARERGAHIEIVVRDGTVLAETKSPELLSWIRTQYHVESSAELLTRVTVVSTSVAESVECGTVDADNVFDVASTMFGAEQSVIINMVSCTSEWVTL